MKSKQLNKGLEQLCEEGVAQLFTRDLDGRSMIGTVGVLQFDVIQYRLENEYLANAALKTYPIQKHVGLLLIIRRC